eukprot:gene462-biopygen15152
MTWKEETYMHVCVYGNHNIWNMIEHGCISRVGARQDRRSTHDGAGGSQMTCGNELVLTMRVSPSGPTKENDFSTSPTSSALCAGGSLQRTKSLGGTCDQMEDVERLLDNVVDSLQHGAAHCGGDAPTRQVTSNVGMMPICEHQLIHVQVGERAEDVFRDPREAVRVYVFLNLLSGRRDVLGFHVSVHVLPEVMPRALYDCTDSCICRHEESHSPFCHATLLRGSVIRHHERVEVTEHGGPPIDSLVEEDGEESEYISHAFGVQWGILERNLDFQPHGRRAGWPVSKDEPNHSFPPLRVMHRVGYVVQRLLFRERPTLLNQ